MSTDYRALLEWAERQQMLTNEQEAPWPPLGELLRMPTVPSLPPELLPEALRPWQVDIAERASIPLEYVACPALVGLGAVIGRKLGIRPQRYDDWLVVVNLWGGVVGRPGMLKSHAISEALKPLARLAAEAREKHQGEISIAQAHLASLDAQSEAVKARMREAAKGKSGADDPADLEAALASILSQKSIAQPVERRYMTQDATTEKLGELLRDNPHGLLVFRDELAGWLRTLDRPGREGDREFFLEAWNGTGGYTVDRIGRGTIHISALTLSVMGGIQPGKLRVYIDEALADGGGADGLLQRLQLLVWPDSIGEWRNVDRWPNRDASERAFQVFKTLDDLPAPEDWINIPALRFADDAQQLFDDWRGELEQRLRSDALVNTPAFESHLAKFRSLMPSLALLFHLVDSPTTFATSPPGCVEDIPPVALEAAQLAASWCEYLEAHARKVSQAELSPGVEGAHTLATHIRAGRVIDGDTVRSIYRDHHWSGLTTARGVLDALEVLKAAGWVRIIEVETGGRPSDIIRLHPALQGRTS